MDRGYRVSLAMATTIVILLAIVPAVSAIMAEISVGNLTRESDTIAIGNITQLESRWNLGRTMIYTYSTLSVEKYIKGGEGTEKLTIITEGGTVGESSVWVEDVPVFTKNETVLVFLKVAGREFSVVGWAQGKYTIENGEVRGIGVERTSLDDFLRHIRNELPLSSSATPVKTSEAPGFEALLGFLGLLAAGRMLTRF